MRLTGVRWPAAQVMAGDLARLLVAVALAWLLVACDGGAEDFAELRQHMDDVRQRPQRSIEPLPEFKAYEPFAYGAAGERSPFEAPEIAQRRRAADDLQVRPDPDRPRQYLEGYTLAELRMVGTLQRAGQRYALVRDENGVVHRVSRGDYMGTNHGRIAMIDEREIELEEIVSDGTGGWLQRTRRLSLAGD